MRDYNYNFASYGLKPFSEMEKLNGFSNRWLSELDVSLWISRHNAGDKHLVIKGFKGIPITLTRPKLQAFSNYLYNMDEILQDPDEIYLFKGKKSYYYTYWKFYDGLAVMIDVSFSASDPFKIDRFILVTGKDIDVKRKGVLYYAKTI